MGYFIKKQNRKKYNKVFYSPVTLLSMSGTAPLTALPMMPSGACGAASRMH